MNNERRKRFREGRKMIWRVKKDENEKKKEAETSTHTQKGDEEKSKRKDEKEKEAQASVHVRKEEKNEKKEEKKIEKEEREKRNRGDEYFKNVRRTRVPFGGSWHARAPKGCWICGHLGHHRDECREEKGFWKKEFIEKKNELKEKRRFFQPKFCLVHGQCGHSTNECGDVQRALSPIKFFKRKPWVFQQPQRYFKEKPLDHRRKFFRYR